MVEILATSEPEAGSVSANAAIAAPLRVFGSHWRLLSGGAEQRNRTGAEALHREGEIGEAGIARQCLADQSQCADVYFFRRIVTRRAVFEPAVAPKLVHQLAASGVNVAVIDILAMLRRPGFQCLANAR